MCGYGEIVAFNFGAKMRFTETVVLLDAHIFGDFDRLCVGGLAKFLSVCGKHLAGVGEISVNGAARGGINGQNLPILSVFRMLFVCFCMFLCTYIGANGRGPRIGSGKARGEVGSFPGPPAAADEGSPPQGRRPIPSPQRTEIVRWGPRIPGGPGPGAPGRYFRKVILLTLGPSGRSFARSRAEASENAREADIPGVISSRRALWRFGINGQDRARVPNATLLK